MAESTDMKVVTDAVTRYVAERIVERQRMLEGETLPVTVRAPVANDDAPADHVSETAAAAEDAGTAPSAQATASAATAAALVSAPATPPRSTGQEAMSGFALVMMGGLAGVAVTLALLRDRIPELASFFG